jgi:hypothetical protein
MKTYLMFAILFCISCSNKTDRFDTKTLDKNASITDSTSSADAVQSTSRAESLTTLPFGPRVKAIKELKNVSADFYHDIIEVDTEPDNVNSNEFRLPINKLNYVHLGVEINDNCIDSSKIVEHFNFTNYSTQLPDVGKKKVFYISGNKFEKVFFGTSRCPDFTFDYYGFILLYDAKLKSADVALIYFERYVDSHSTRKFWIDKDYNIIVLDMMFSEGQENVDELQGPAYLLSLGEKGIMVKDFKF